MNFGAGEIGQYTYFCLRFLGVYGIFQSSPPSIRSPAGHFVMHAVISEIKAIDCNSSIRYGSDDILNVTFLSFVISLE